MSDRPSAASVWYMLRAVLAVVGDPSEALGFHVKYGSATAQTLGPVTVEGKPAGVVLLAAAPLEAPLPAGPITIPESARKQCEGVLELSARMIALDRRVPHSLASPHPCVGFLGPTAAETRALDGREVLNAPVNNTAVAGVANVGLFDGSRLDLLQDRLDGVVLLTEALNAKSPLGQFSQLWRFFERAFKSGHTEARGAMVDFLGGSRHVFEEVEIDGWLKLRNPSIHANRPGQFNLDSDVQPFVPRMLEAAYDVLLNKEVWWSKSPERRNAWSPTSGSADRHGGIFVTQGPDASLRAQLFDEFEAYPMLLAGPLDEVLPKAAWYMTDDTHRYLSLRGTDRELDLK